MTNEETNEERSLYERDGRLRFEKPKVVVCEGIEEERFFPRLLIIRNESALIDNIQFVNCGGKPNLEGFLRGARNFTGFSQVTSIGIVLDADTQPKGTHPTFEKAQNAFRSIQFPVPTQMGKPEIASGKRAIAWIMPNNQDDGELEDLCLRALTNHDLMACVQQIEECIGKITQLSSKPAKARLYTLLAWLDPPGRRLAEVSNSEIQSWGLEVFDPIINSFFSQL
jgi:hypothetical protein